MNNDIFELERLNNLISERLISNKNSLSFTEKYKLNYLKKCLIERNRISYMAYFDNDIFKNSDKKERFSRECYDQVDNEKKQFNEKIYNLFKKIEHLGNEQLDNKHPGNKHLGGYDEEIIKKAINEFLFDILCIKEKADIEKTKLLYQKFGRRRGENSTYTFYTDIKNRCEGLDTTNFCDELFNLILEGSSLKSEIYSIKNEYIFYNKTISDLLTLKNNDSFLEIKKLLEEKNDNLLNFNDQMRKKDKTDAIFYEYLYIEKLKYFLYENLEYNFILKPEKVKNITNLKDEISSHILKYVKELDIRSKETSRNISKKSKNYLESYQKEYKNIFKEDYFKRNIEDMQKLDNKKFIDKLEKYLYIYLAEVDIKATIKDYLTINFISWLKYNDFISELKMYIELLEELKNVEKTELEKRLETSIKEYKKISKKEKMKRDIFKEHHVSFVSSEVIFIKERLSYSNENTKKEQNKSYIEILGNNYNKEYQEYKNLLCIKFIKLKLYLLEKGQEIYFKDFIEAIRLYYDILCKGLEITSQLNLKSAIDELFLGEIKKIFYI